MFTSTANDAGGGTEVSGGPYARYTLTGAFGFSWEDWLSEDEIILNHEISSSGSELVITNDYHTSSSVIFLASGGVNRTRYSVLCTIETSASQIAQRTMKIDIKNR